MASLDALPIEIQHSIFSYLIRPLSFYQVDGMPRDQDLFSYIDALPTSRACLNEHPFYNLAASCHQLRFSVECYCRHIILAYKISDPSKYRRTDISEWSNMVAQQVGLSRRSIEKTWRFQWVKMAYQRCIFCGKPSRRRAVFNLLMWCCLACDNTHYGKRVSKSEALSKYKVTEIHWRTPRVIFPDSQLRPLSVAISNISACSGATLLLEKEVVELAEYVKKNDPSGKLLRATRKQLKEKAKDDQASSHIRVLQEVVSSLLRAAPGLSVQWGDSPNEMEYRAKAARLRLKLSSHVEVLERALGHDKRAAGYFFDMLLQMMQTDLSHLYKVVRVKQGGLVQYHLGIEPQPQRSGDGSPDTLPSLIPIIVLGDRFEVS